MAVPPPVVNELKAKKGTPKKETKEGNASAKKESAPVVSAAQVSTSSEAAKDDPNGWTSDEKVSATKKYCAFLFDASFF